MTSTPPPWEPDDAPTDETRALPEVPGPEDEQTAVTRRQQPVEEPTQVYREPPPRERVVVEEEVPPPGGRPLWPWLLLGLGLLLAALVAFFWLTGDDDADEPEARPVPSVVRLPVADAERILTEQGFAVEVQRQASDEAAEGIVFAQQPEAGTELAEGETVTISVSSGPASTTVPNVVGSSQADAVAALEEAELTANVVAVPSDEAEGTVVAQAPAAGEQVERGSSVRLNVSGGPGAATVPDVVGSTADEAVAALREAGLTGETRDVDSDEPAGTVVAQEPEAGTELDRGSSVTIDVSRGPQGQSVPDVVGLPEDEARSELEALGFRVRVVQETAPDTPAVGIVLRQVPEAGRQAPENAQVTIVVGA